MKKQIIGSYDEAVEYIMSTPKFTTKNSMEDTKAFLCRLGNPDRKLKIIHVAGTNGKGSTCSYMKSILEAAGKRIALFTSPHLVDVRERFRIGSEMVSEVVFYNAFIRVYNALDWDSLEKEGGYHPTFFEYLFFMAMLIFSEEEIDYCILETGLGGRLDATNSVENKVLSVITRISLEHVEYLGNSIGEIAGEKAGIIMNRVPVVFSDVEQEATRVFLEKAKELSSPAYPVSKNDYRVLNLRNKSIDFSYVSRYDKNVCTTLCLHTIAHYQVENCALALRAVEILDTAHEITVQQIYKGVENCFWEGRMEEVLPDTFVDGAHNEDGIRAFLETVAQDGHRGKRTLLFSVVADKDYRKMIGAIGRSGLFDKLVVARLNTSRAASFEDLEVLLQQVTAYHGEHYEDVISAFESCLNRREEGERIYVAGSLYLVGEIKEFLGND
ncbi:MAG: bifunctional folylpolyglutamate synthase/dihydrofolate synthase [Lachnospiraceae bacterium]|nr:bifunctional folylpolyglutamate synthase/dihydrofolate synthase [Lachnospiraceae bacterium]